ncbi:MAG: hypothetical protein ACJ8MO_38295 [Bacillus sp. (in: firmicutes)]
MLQKIYQEFEFWEINRDRLYRLLDEIILKAIASSHWLWELIAKSMSPTHF